MVQSRTRELAQEGKPVDEVVETLQAELQAKFSGMAQPARIAGAVKAAYAEASR
jgi:hypothetical protein